MPRFRFLAILIALTLAASASFADRADVTMTVTNADDPTRARAEGLARAARELGAAERHALGPLSRNEFKTLTEEVSGGPLRIGLVRNLTQRLELSAIDAIASPDGKRSIGGGLLRREPDGSLTWTLAITSTAAHALRLHFDRFLLPDGARAWIYSEEGEAHGPYTNEFVRSIVSDGRDFWTHTVYAPVVYLEVQFRGATAPLDISIDSVAHIEYPFPEESAGLVAEPEATECFVDVACASGDAELIASLSRAAARLSYAKGGSFYFCTGSLVNVSKTAEFEPYMLTANHCFDSQSSASSLEAVWDYRAASCGSTAPNPSGLPRNLGATLLSSAAASDFTFIELLQPPPGTRSYLGWNANSSALSDGMSFYRVAHPQGGAQRFSRNTYTVSPSPGVCGSLPLSSFLYSRGAYGGTTGGSSGGPMTNGSTQILGQLYGKCGDATNPCNYTPQSTVDGAFSATFTYISDYLNPASGGGQPCSPSSTTLCAQSNRFAITLTARDPRSGKTDSGYVMNSTDVFGYFAFPSIAGNQTDPQVFVKVLDGRPVNGRWWVFYASLTDVEFTLTVTDTQSGAVKIYSQPAYTQKSSNDTSAFN